ncbi:KRAB [Mytilus edulis]|uniref:KRAB n=1 Tax=Mytilus edulis TaxID=6550 RepID=A0A8S3T9U6_MYTED|nr:KRAB [Mytilus edulis]
MHGSEDLLYKCKTCGKCFESTSRLKIHERSHSDDKMFKCVLCGKGYKYKCTLENHMKVCDCQHTKEDLDEHTEDAHKYVCEECNKTFASASGFQNHRKLLHGSGEHLFTCKTCGKSYGSSSRLKIHAASHSTIQLFQCTIYDADALQCHCGKRYKSKTGLLLHQRKHSKTSLSLVLFVGKDTQTNGTSTNIYIAILEHRWLHVKYVDSKQCHTVDTGATWRDTKEGYQRKMEISMEHRMNEPFRTCHFVQYYIDRIL